MSTSNFVSGKPFLLIAVISATPTTTKVNLGVAPASDYIIQSVLVSNADSIAHNVRLTILDPTPDECILAYANLAAGPGGLLGNAAPTDLIGSGTPASVTGIPLAGGTQAYVGVHETVNSGSLVTCVALCYYR